jgi:hypothetical protein
MSNPDNKTLVKIFNFCIGFTIIYDDRLHQQMMAGITASKSKAGFHEITLLPGLGKLIEPKVTETTTPEGKECTLRLSLKDKPKAE